MDFININDTVQSVIRISKGVAREYGNGCYAPCHILYALMQKEIGLHSFVETLFADVTYIREWAQVRVEEYPKENAMADIMPDEKVKVLFEEADNVRLKWGLLEINPLCVLAAMTVPQTVFSIDELRSFPIKEREIHELFLSSHTTSKNKKDTTTSREVKMSDFDPLWNVPGGNIEKYCTDKTADAQNDKIHPIVCRERETRMMMEILGRMGKPNVLIIGDAGVGKTAMVDGLACMIANDAVPQYLKGVTIFELDSGTLIAGATYKGEIEERLKGIIKELDSHDNTILFIDEIHTLIDPKSGNNGAASILKPELAKGNITVIGATTIDEYRKLIEPDHALSRRFEVLQVAEPDTVATVNMIESVLKRYENYHEVGVDRQTLPDCVALAKRYVKERKLPDAAIDLIDRTLSAVKMINQSGAGQIEDFAKDLADIEAMQEVSEAERADKIRLLNFSLTNKLSPILLGMLSDVENTEPTTYQKWIDYTLSRLKPLQEITKNKISTITSHHIAAVVSAATGIPIGKIESGERDRLLDMENLLRERVIGQDTALKVLADAIVESRSGLNKPGQPIGSFFLLGPTGTGKTELAKALAEALFNDEKAMIRFDMSEFKEEHSAALLLGAPPGYVGYEEGGVLVNRIRRQPYAVVLFDEIEKAHASVYDIFLQIMDEGKLHDKLGKEGDFSNSIVLFTSNVGSGWFTEQINGGKVPQTTEIMEVMGQYFRPEFLGRLSEIVPFNPISEQMLVRIFEIQLKGVLALLDKQGISMAISDEAKRELSHRGFTPKYGARQVAGAIRTYIRRPISKMIISGKISAGDKVVIELAADGEITYDVKQ